MGGRPRGAGMEGAGLQLAGQAPGTSGLGLWPLVPCVSCSISGSYSSAGEFSARPWEPKKARAGVVASGRPSSTRALPSGARCGRPQAGMLALSPWRMLPSPTPVWCSWIFSHRNNS